MSAKLPNKLNNGRLFKIGFIVIEITIIRITQSVVVKTRYFRSSFLFLSILKFLKNKLNKMSAINATKMILFIKN